ncbi:MAG TPA: MBL fold metallo-hydrolase [Vicinamibacterales bacterium]|nr:MBL fold metallo-hydrolase [Vicinamibacterales bacterium]
MLRTVILFAVVAMASAATAQPRTAFPDKRGHQKSEFPRVVKIAENVYGYEDFHNAGMTTVSMFVVGRDGVMLVDGQGSVGATQKLVDAIATTARLPIKWYVVGSDHGDHTAGNSVLPAGITYIVHPTSRAQLERDAATAKGANEKAAAEAAAKGTPAPAPRTVVVPPVAMTGDQQVIDVGGIEAQVLFLGRAHTGGDLMVYLPKHKILFMSEAYLNRVFPATRSAYPSEWVKTIDRALAMDVDIYVPGHGFIEQAKASREELVEYQKALKSVIGEVTRLHKAGLSVEEARKQANWGVYKEWMLADQQDITAIRKIYEEIEGTLK